MPTYGANRAPRRKLLRNKPFSGKPYLWAAEGLREPAWASRLVGQELGPALIEA